MNSSFQIDACKIVRVFNRLFIDSFNTELICAQSMYGRTDPRSEIPLYTPSPDAGQTHKIYFANGFASSALHEIAHWCIAGQKRRLLPDYGYWYHPGARSPEQQMEFERFEARNQGLEWILSKACNMNFHVSFDNFERTTEKQIEAFKRQVHMHACTFVSRGLPKRALLLASELQAEFEMLSPFDSNWSTDSI